MFWLKAIHIIFLTSWMAGLFYLPRLFVYHASCVDEAGHQRFLVMERKLYYYIMCPACVLTSVFGFWMVFDGFSGYWSSTWFLLKLGLVALLFFYHLACGYWYHAFKNGKNCHSHVYFRWMNEVPTVIFVLITILVVVKPFGIL